MKKTFKKFSMKGTIRNKDSWRTNRGILLNYLLIQWNICISGGENAKIRNRRYERYHG